MFQSSTSLIVFYSFDATPSYHCFFLPSFLFEFKGTGLGPFFLLSSSGNALFYSVNVDVKPCSVLFFLLSLPSSRLT